MSVGKKPRKPLPRYTRLRSSGRPRPRSRSASETERIYGTEAHQEWLRGLPCLGCGQIGTAEHPHHLHHTKNGGMGRKADAEDQVPLCYICHGHVHHYGPSAFGIDALRNQAKRLAAVWKQRQSDLTPLSAIVPGVVAKLMGGK